MIYPSLPNVAVRCIRFGFLFFVLMGCLCQGASHASPPGHIRGIVSGVTGNETLPGVHVYLVSTGSGVVTNNYGYYSIAVAALPDTLVFSYVGFETQKHVITLQSDTRLDVQLTENNLLPEVEVQAAGRRKIVETPVMSMISVPVMQIQNTPALLGEKDVFKVLQLMPGVQGGNEGSTGIFVRGGGNDQNLVILDDAVVYNVNHLFGVFSLFNGNALKNVDLYKGGFPARYGGRVSSVLDLTMKDGSLEKYSAEGSLGLISSSFTVDGPIVKDKGSFVVSGRRTYHDVWMNRVMADREKLVYYFYDLNLKGNWIFDKNNRLYLSGFMGRDKMFANDYDQVARNQMGVNWGNTLLTLRWNRIFGSGLFANTSLVFSKYNNNVFTLERTTLDPRQHRMDYASGVRDLGLKYDLQWAAGRHHIFRMGAVVTWHHFQPAAVKNQNEFTEEFWQDSFTLDAMESGIYLEDEIQVGKWMFNAGLRVSQYMSGGSNFIRPEPRLNVAWKVFPSTSLKASYARMNQYMHLSSNTGTQMPTGFWLPVTKKLQPQSSVQYALGLASMPFQNDIEFTIEGWYKEISNALTYADNASFLLFDPGNATDPFESWEDNMVQGEAISKGIEMMLHKKEGKINGWIAYTLSDARNRFDEVNQGSWYPSDNHRRHDIAINVGWDIFDRTTLGVTWVYTSGRMITLPTSSSRIFSPQASRQQPFEESYWYFNADYYSARNTWRSHNYHRLDIGFRFSKPLKWGTRTWEIGLYNAYNRMNPFQYFICHDYDTGERRLKQRTLLPLIPSVSYNFKF